MANNIGTGTTITFGTSSFTASLLNVQGPGQSRPSIDTSHMGSTARTFVPGDLIDGGDVEIEMIYTGALNPPIDQVLETITIDWGGSGNTSAFSGFMTNFNPGAPLEEQMTATATLKVAGAITGD